MVSRQIVGYTVAMLVAMGVIAGILAGLMTADISSNDSTNNDLNNPPEDAYSMMLNVPNLGKIQGAVLPEGSGVFYGIPYSQPPVGDYRFKRPRDPLPWGDGVFNATSRPAACPQVCIQPSPEYSCPIKEEMNEDCLNLNIHLPKRLMQEENGIVSLVSDIHQKKLPVMVFIYGGAFTTGGNSLPLYDGRYMAEQGNVIVVSPNYRVGPLGFLYMDFGDPNDIAGGNYGIYDQIKALEWIQNHIVEFGGDPDEVTIFGQSAGAQSVSVLLVSELSAPLFKRAILQSDPFGLPFKDVKDAQKLGETFADFAGCSNDLQCMRDLPVQDILSAYATIPYAQIMNYRHISQVFEPYSPVIETDLLPDDPLFMFSQGLDQNKPMIIGSTIDEGMLFVEAVLSKPLQSQTAYIAIAKIMYRGLSQQVLEQYPPDCPVITGPASKCDERYSMNTVVTDYDFLCPQRKAIRSPTRGENSNVWYYYFDQLWSFPEFWEEYVTCYDKVCHCAELPYVFNMDALSVYSFSEEESALADMMVKYWTNFAKYGNPNGEVNEEQQVPFWPKYFDPDPSDMTTEYQGLYISGSDQHVIKNLKKDKCDFWDNLDFYNENRVLERGMEYMIRHFG